MKRKGGKKPKKKKRIDFFGPFYQYSRTSIWTLEDARNGENLTGSRHSLKTCNAMVARYRAGSQTNAPLERQ